MPTDEKNLEGTQEEKNQEGEEETQTEGSQETSTDPLDSMSEEGVKGYLAGLGVDVPEDTEDIVAFAKKERAIKNRHAKKELETNQPSNKTDDDAIKRFEKANERKAIRLIETSDNEDYSEINENWEEIVANYVPRRGRDTEEDILDDIMDAHAIWKRRQTPVSTKDKEAASAIAQTKGIKGNSPSPEPKRKEKIIKRTQKMGDWYK